MSVIVSEQKFTEKEIKDFVHRLKALSVKLMEENREAEKYLLEFLIARAESISKDKEELILIDEPIEKLALKALESFKGTTMPIATQLGPLWRRTVA
jgi:DNA-directed RNA polymerase subunit F